MSKKKEKKTIAQLIIETVEKVNTPDGVTRLELHNEIENLISDEYDKGFQAGYAEGVAKGKAAVDRIKLIVCNM